MSALSVVIPTYRRPDLLSRCLDAVLAQTLDPSRYEVIIVDDGRDDGTREFVLDVARRTAGRPGVRYLRPTSTHGPAGARNLGWQTAVSPVIAFTDDDTVPDADWLVCGLQAMAAGQGAVCGRVVVPVEGLPTDHARMTQGLERAEFVTANAFVRRDALARAGGFDERFTRAWREDSDLQFSLMELGYEVGKASLSVVLHPVRPAPWGISLGQQKNVFFDALLFKKHPALYRERIRQRPPWLYFGIVAACVLALVGAVEGWPAFALVAAAVAFAGVLAFTCWRLNGTSRHPRHVVEMFLTSLAIPFLALYWRVVGAWHFRTLFP